MNVEIHIPVERIEVIEDDRANETIEEHTPTRIVVRHDVTENPNFDHYLQPKADLLSNYLSTTGVFSYGGVEYQRTSGEVEIEFEAYQDEVRAAAQNRAAEDWCHEVHTLAEWLNLAQKQYPDLARVIQRALDRASDDNPEAEYEIAHNGGADVMEDTSDGSLDGKGVEAR